MYAWVLFRNGVRASSIFSILNRSETAEVFCVFVVHSYIVYYVFRMFVAASICLDTFYLSNQGTCNLTSTAALFMRLARRLDEIVLSRSPCVHNLHRSFHVSPHMVI